MQESDYKRWARLHNRGGEPRWVKCYRQDDLTELVYFHGRYRPTLAQVMPVVPHYGLMYIPRLERNERQVDFYVRQGFERTDVSGVYRIEWTGVGRLRAGEQPTAPVRLRPYDYSLGVEVHFDDIASPLARAVKKAYCEIWQLPTAPGSRPTIFASVVEALRARQPAA